MRKTDTAIEIPRCVPVVGQKHRGVAQVGPCMVRDARWDACIVKIRAHLVQRVAGPIGHGSILYDRAEQISRRVGHARDIDCDRLQVDRTGAWRLS